MMTEQTKEQQLFKLIQHWEPVRKIIPAEELINKKDRFYPLFLYLYNQTKQAYKKVPQRKNGEDPFIHPINTVLNLKRAKIEDPLIFCTGIIHDLIEEKVDLYKKEEKIKENKEGIKKLDQYEKQIFKELKTKMTECCFQNNLSQENVKTIIHTLKLLTRHKRHSYYASVACIFNCPNHQIKKSAIKIKLADRTHNILCIECFTKQERIYQCFKNIFILNNTKKFLMDRYGQKIFTHKQFSTTEYLFNKCSRATYDAFLNILYASTDQKTAKIKTLLQLAFKKYAFEVSGMKEITKLSKKIIHPMRLFQGVVRKYDQRLHLEWDKFNETVKTEKEYCQKFLADLHLNEKQVQAILEYKDAYFLKELVAKLLYQQNYLITGFLTSEVSRKGRIPRWKIN